MFARSISCDFGEHRNVAALILGFICLLLTLPAGTTYGRALTGSQTKEEECDWGPETAGGRLCVQLKNETIHLGEPVMLVVTLRNVGTEMLWFPTKSVATDLEVEVVNDKGRRMPETAELTMERSRVDNPGWSRSDRGGIPPGEQSFLEYSVDRWFEIRDAGQYTISIKKRVFDLEQHRSFFVDSKPVQITVLPPS